MNQKIVNYIEGIFAPFNKKHQVDELKAELLMDLQERYSDLIIMISVLFNNLYNF